MIPIFPLVNVPAVQALLKTGQGELRFYSFGRAPQTPVKPYAVWRPVYGNPENNLSDRPDMDFYGVQVDVYADPTLQGAAQARAIITALRDALELSAHIVAWRGEDRDPNTQDFTIGFDVDFWVPR